MIDPNLKLIVISGNVDSIRFLKLFLCVSVEMTNSSFPYKNLLIIVKKKIHKSWRTMQISVMRNNETLNTRKLIIYDTHLACVVKWFYLQHTSQACSEK